MIKAAVPVQAEGIPRLSPATKDFSGPKKFTASYGFAFFWALFKLNMTTHPFLFFLALSLGE